MKKLLKWVGIALGGLVGLAALAAIVLYVWSSLILNRSYAFEPRTVAIPSDPDSLALGVKGGTNARPSAPTVTGPCCTEVTRRPRSRSSPPTRPKRFAIC